MAKTMFCFNKNSAKNESQTIVSITQKHHYKTRLAVQQNYFQPRKRTELGKMTFSYIGPKIWPEVPVIVCDVIAHGSTAFFSLVC